MYRDTLILLILKEIFHDKYLVNIIYNIVLNDEILLNLDLHVTKTSNLREDIGLFYPGFIKTSLFENIRFNNNDDIEPGYSVFKVKPLTGCGFILDYNSTPPIKMPIYKYGDYTNNKYNCLRAVNNMRKKYILTKYGKEKIKLINKKRRRYAKNEIKDLPVLSVWYDFENNIFTNV